MVVDYVRVYRSSAEPVVNVGGVVDAASFSGTLAPGSLASVFGTGLADATYGGLFDKTLNTFPLGTAGISVSVNGQTAPLTFVSAGQINFQIPWATPMDTAVNVQVTRAGAMTYPEPVTLSATGPSVFEANGTAIQTCDGGACTLWGNGFGAKVTAQRDGAPASSSPLPWTTNTCSLSISGMPVTVLYCGAAPGLIIDQLNFLYPAGFKAGAGMVTATLKVGAVSSDFQIGPITP